VRGENGGSQAREREVPEKEGSGALAPGFAVFYVSDRCGRRYSARKKIVERKLYSKWREMSLVRKLEGVGERKIFFLHIDLTR
jgi:hypothetical protein